MSKASQNAAILHGRQNQVQELKNSGSDLPWYKNAGLLKLNILVSVVFVGQALNGYDGSLVSGFQAFPSWIQTMGYPSPSAIGLLNAAVYISGFLTSPFAAWVSDRFGRRWCVQYTAWTNLLGTVIGCAAGSGHSSGYGMFMASRIICGSGIAFATMVSPIMLQELPHPSQRTKMAGFFDCAFNIGGFLVAWVIFGCSSFSGSSWSWRIPYLIHIPFAIFMLAAVLMIPESPRWLMSKGRDAEARAFLVEYHANGCEHDELVDFEMQEIRETLDYEKTHHASSWKAMFGTKGNRHRLACVVLIASCQNLSGTAIISYYYTNILALVGITAPGQTTGINAGLTSFTFFCALFGLWMTQRINRRPQLAISWILTIISNVGITACTAVYAKTGNKGAGVAAVVFLWLYNGSFFISCGPLFFSYQVEILSYATRAKGMMIWSFAAKGLSIFNAYCNPVALAEIGWKYFLVYTATLVVTGVLMYFLIVETRGYTLEEIAVLFDGEDTAFSKMAEIHPDEKKFQPDIKIKQVDSDSQ